MSKVVVITGVSSGIGLEVAQLLAKKSYKVYGFSRKKVKSQDFFSMQVDITNKEQIEKAMHHIIEKESKIDILINNAGMGISGSVEATHDNDIDHIFDVNFKGLHHMITYSLPHLRKTKGKIINVGSVAGPLAIPFQTFYSASKAAVQTYTEALSIELKPFGIQVCTILPGDIKTEFTKNRRKNKQELQIYEQRVVKSIGVMEKDEQNGMDVSYAAKVFLKLCNKRKIPLHKTIGFKYKVFILLNKILPKRLVVYIISKLYGFTHER